MLPCLVCCLRAYNSYSHCAVGCACCLHDLPVTVDEENGGNKQFVDVPATYSGKSYCPFSRAARAALVSVLPEETVTTHWVRRCIAMAIQALPVSAACTVMTVHA